jgi:hypothetical protein
MKRPAIGILAAALFATSVCASRTSDDALTTEMAARIAKNVAPAKVRVTESLTLAISHGGQDSITINLDRIVEFCRTNEADACEDFKSRFVAATSDADAETAISRTNLRLVVRAADYVDGINSMFADTPGRTILTDKFVQGISLVLLADFPKTARATNADDLRTLGLSRDEAWMLGRKQMIEHLPAIPTAKALSNGLVAITDVDYAASIMLADGWDQLSASIGPGLFLAVPDDNFALVGVENDASRLTKVKGLVRDHFTRAERGISPLVYRRVGGMWVPVD